MDFLTPIIIVVAIIGAMIVGFGVWLVALLAARLEGPTDLRPPRTPSTDPAQLLVLALGSLVYIVMMAMVYGSGPAVDGQIDPNTGGIDAALEEVFEAVKAGTILLLWILLAILLVRDGTKGNVRIVAAVMLPLSGVAAIFAGVLRSRYGGWSIMVPALLPPLIAFYAMWARHPILNAALPAKIINPAAWGMVVILTLAALPLVAIDAWTYTANAPRRQAKLEALAAQRAAEMAEFDRQFEEKQRRDKARLEAISADSPLAALLDDLKRPHASYPGAELPPGSYTDYDKALAKAGQIKSRQADVVTLLKLGKIESFEDLWRLGIEATPAVCEAYGDALHQEAANIGGYDAGEREFAVDRQLPNIKWLVSKRCDLDAVLAFVETRLREYCQSCGPTNDDHEWHVVLPDTLAALRRTH